MGLKEVIDSTETLKNVPRFGWLQCGVPLAVVESVAEHVFQTSILSLLIAYYLEESGREVNVREVLELALIHDLPEAKISDLPKSASRLFGEEVKRESEKLALQEILAGTPIEQLANTASKLKEESLESRIVKIADNLSALIRGLKYNKLGYQTQDIINTSISEVRRLCLNDELTKRFCEELLESIGVQF